MKKLIQQFFILHKSFSIEGLGTFSVEKDAAFHDFANSLIYPANEKISFIPTSNSEVESKFIQFVKDHGNITRTEVDSYLQSLKNIFANTQMLDIEGIGILKQGANSFQITPSYLTDNYLSPIETSHVIHQGDLHDIKVGEQVKTNAEMRALLAERKPRDYWWIYALILVLAAVGALLYYLFALK